MDKLKVALIDLKESEKGCSNKDKAGTFGNASHGEGVISKLYASIKRKNVETPVVHFGYIAALFRSHGHEVQITDGLPHPDVNLVIIASTIVGYDEELAYARSIRKDGRKIGFISAFATAKPEIFLEASDFVILGEPEAAIVDFLKGNKDLSGAVSSILLTDLDSLPFPDWDGFPIHRYSYYPIIKFRPVLPVLSSRGCAFDCTYCPYMVTQTEKFRSRSPQNTVDEIERNLKQYGIRGFLFRDIMFTHNKKRSADIAEEILRRNLKVTWTIETRSDCINEELLALFHRAGLRGIHLGIESPREDIQKKSGRIPIKETQQEKIVRICQKIGIKVLGFYIFGFLDDTPDTMQLTIDYAKRLNTTLAQFDVMTPYPGTKFYEEIKSRIQDFDWKKYTTHHSVLKLDHIGPEDVMHFKNKAYREYYFRPSWFLKNAKLLFLS